VAAGLPQAAGDRGGAAEAREGAGIAEAANVTGLGDDRGREVGAGAEEVVERVVVLGEQLGDLCVQRGDSVVEVVDVVCEFADAARRGALGQAVAEADALLSWRSSRWRSQRMTDASATGSSWVPPDGLGAVADRAPALQLEHPQHADELGLGGRAQKSYAATAKSSTPSTRQPPVQVSAALRVSAAPSSASKVEGAA
jgi:hypothetical protein